MENPGDQVSNNFGGFEILKERQRMRERDESVVDSAAVQEDFFLFLRNFAYSGLAAAGFMIKMGDAFFGGFQNAFGAGARQLIYNNLPVGARNAFWTVALWCYERTITLGRLHRGFNGVRRAGDPFEIHRNLIQGQSDLKMLMTVLSFLGGVGVVMRRNSAAYRELMHSSIVDKDRLVEVSRKALKDTFSEVKKLGNPPKDLEKKNLILDGIDISTAKEGLLGASRADRTNGKMAQSSPAVIAPSSNAGRLLAYLMLEDEDKFPLDRRVQINDGSSFVYF